jgi:hypothetical protein
MNNFITMSAAAALVVRRAEKLFKLPPFEATVPQG